MLSLFFHFWAVTLIMFTLGVVTCGVVGTYSCAGCCSRRRLPVPLACPWMLLLLRMSVARGREVGGLLQIGPRSSLTPQMCEDWVHPLATCQPVLRTVCWSGLRGLMMGSERMRTPLDH